VENSSTQEVQIARSGHRETLRSRPGRAPPDARTGADHRADPGAATLVARESTMHMRPKQKCDGMSQVGSLRGVDTNPATTGRAL
jgi:hypothetical protein